MLPAGRLCGLPGLLPPRAGRSRRRAATRPRPGCVAGRRGRLLEPGLVCRSAAQQHAAPRRRATGRVDLPRTGAPALLPAGRHGVQRVLRQLRGASGLARVARAAWPAGARWRGGATAPGVRCADSGHPRTPARALCRAALGGGAASGQGRGLGTVAGRLPPDARGRPGGQFRPFHGRAAEQRQPAALRAVRPVGAGLRAAVRRGGRGLVGLPRGGAPARRGVRRAAPQPAGCIAGGAGNSTGRRRERKTRRRGFSRDASGVAPHRGRSPPI